MNARIEAPEGKANAAVDGGGLCSDGGVGIEEQVDDWIVEGKRVDGIEDDEDGEPEYPEDWDASGRREDLFGDAGESE